jgi:hypothetical protein
VNLSYRVVRPSHRPETIRDRFEIGLEDRLQHHFQRRLNNPVSHGWYPEASNLPRPTRLGNLALPHRQRPKRARLELGTQVAQESRNTDTLLDIGDPQAVDASGARTCVARDSVERHE